MQKEIVETDSGILDICMDFYEKLFVDKDIVRVDEEETDDSFTSIPEDQGDQPYCFLPDKLSLHLKHSDIEVLDEEVSFEELRQSVLKMKKGKSPWLDGLTVYFYQEFFDVLGPPLHESLTYAFHHGELSILQKRGIIKLIPKKDKDSTFVKNLRPITLLNVDVKILSRALAVQVQSVIESIITKDQNAFIKGRNIGENILDVYSMIAAVDDNEECGILVFLDIEKACDTVSWRLYVYSVMQVGLS